MPHFTRRNFSKRRRRVRPPPACAAAASAASTGAVVAVAAASRLKRGSSASKREGGKFELPPVVGLIRKGNAWPPRTWGGETADKWRRPKVLRKECYTCGLCWRRTSLRTGGCGCGGGGATICRAVPATPNRRLHHHQCCCGE